MGIFTSKKLQEFDEAKALRGVADNIEELLDMCATYQLPLQLINKLNVDAGMLRVMANDKENGK